jgi:sialate O-acetylesterase
VKAQYLALTALLLVGLLAGAGFYHRSQQPRVIYCLGDSITSGFRLQNPDRDSFPSQLAQLTGGRYKVINGGVPGATLIKKGDIPIWKQTQMQDVVNSHPDIVVLMLGTNDTKNGNWKFIDNFEHDYRELLILLKNIDTHPKVIACSIPPVMHDMKNGFSSVRISEINIRVERIARKMAVLYDDIFPSLINHEELYLDDVHPNEKGAHLLAEKVFEAL